jgi:hypothetical protein
MSITWDIALRSDDDMVLTISKCYRLRTQRWLNQRNNYCYLNSYCNLPPFEQIHLSETPKRSLTIRNAGGSSELSEALSMQVMYQLYGVTQFVPEKEVEYWIDYKMCDYLMVYQGTNIGVSVTRALMYPFEDDFTTEKAHWLVTKKLSGLVLARQTVNVRHQFYKSLLHIWCISSIAASNVRKVYDEIVANDQEHVYCDILVMCTICPDRYIYTNWLPTDIHQALAPDAGCLTS